ncbi:virus protein of unknown function [Alkalithermobacter thermoalcaliphilus JW-YL-7 = DSM 7308]|uniref:Peptidase S74 domain-containing protein n=1 Tax=Alkalithermobacter thermoalcaliphilus JW-YL-7 = DSM 7308 TaxID=1121328 RepID=A0A150FQW0_CLOPD|nr:protein of unknown function DUF859 [[Clostridium] paradoxum JW-YL-7 = DSM 7308]SHL13946.1 virus protein of unknown function [[Clostridium] paradoxum JW-YL-7 = DSM 7308]
MSVLSGTLTNNFGTGYSIQIEWSANQNITNNTSTITANFFLISRGSSYTINSSVGKTVRITIDGTTYSTSSANISLSGNQKKLLFTASRTISHNADGTRTFGISGNVDLNVTLSGTYYGTVSIANQNFTLQPIPRASTITTYNNFTIGDSIPISLNRHSTSFTHTLEFKVGNTTIATRTGIGASTTVNLSTAEQDAIYRLIPNSTTATVTLFVTTFSGSTKIGDTVSQSRTATVASSIVPTFNTITHSENVSVVATEIGGYVQNLSRLNLAITGATGSKFSTITSYRITVDGVSYNSQTATSNIITSSGAVTITGTVTDSRGRTSTKSVSINVLPYSTPFIQTFSVQRCNADGTPNPLGNHALVTRSATVSWLNNKNTLNYRILSRQRGTTTWSTRVDQTITTDLTGTNILTGYDIDKAYDFRLEIIDKFNTTISYAILSTGEMALSISKTGIGVGKIWQQGSLDVQGESYFNGNINVNGSINNANIDASRITSGRLNINRIPLGTTSSTVAVGNHTHNSLLNANFVQSTGRSSSWGSTNGTSTGAFNAVMGTGASATWLLSGTSNGVFRAGIQALDADGTLRFYSGTNYFVFHNGVVNSPNGFAWNGESLDDRYYRNGAGSANLALESTALRTNGIVSNNASSGLYIGVADTGEVRVTNRNGWNAGGTITYRPIRASSFPTGSSIKWKTNVEELDIDTEKIVKDAKLFKYNLKDEFENGIDRKKYGFVIENGCPKEILFDDEAIDTYNTVSILWSAVQKLMARVEELENKIKETE